MGVAPLRAGVLASADPAGVRGLPAGHSPEGNPGSLGE
jgi:hypothetical protein